MCDLLRSVGYSAARTAGSHGLYDIVAFDAERVLIIQCKTGKGRFTNEDRNELIGHAIGHGAQPVLAQKDAEGHIRFTYLMELKRRGERTKPGDDLVVLLENSRGELRPESGEPAEVSRIPGPVSESASGGDG